ncbi:MAG TPA: RcpC/CpaB family pilus assembly protein [Actinomycetota bacterium]|nr:RcpC/CpaB family pilus assembly protein [Actinomycetota bacterium]
MARISSPTWTSVAATTIRAGDLVSRSDLRPSAAPGGLGVMSIPVEREHAVGGALAPGDRVDVIEVRDGGARYLLRGAEVLAVGSRDGRGFVEGSIGAFSVTIAVDPQAALDIARAIREAGVEIVRTTGVQATPEASPTSG